MNRPDRKRSSRLRLLATRQWRPRRDSRRSKSHGRGWQRYLQFTLRTYLVALTIGTILVFILAKILPMAGERIQAGFSHWNAENAGSTIYPASIGIIFLASIGLAIAVGFSGERTSFALVAFIGCSSLIALSAAVANSRSLETLRVEEATGAHWRQGLFMSYAIIAPLLTFVVWRARGQAGDAPRLSVWRSRHKRNSSAQVAPRRSRSSDRRSQKESQKESQKVRS